MAQLLSNLPITGVLPEIAQQWATQQRWVIEAAPGAGKSTELPLFLLKQRLHQGKIVLVQPRRAAAKTVAQRIATQLGEPIGGKVGYQVAKEQAISQHTQLIVMTTGVLLQYLASDSTLAGIDTVLLDEFHERTWQLDALYAICQQLSWLRDDFHVLVLSATLPGDHIAKAMDAKLIKVAGRQYPVAISYQASDDVLGSAEKVIRATPCPTLVFLPGRRWITQLQQQITDRPVYPLHSGLTLAQQQATIDASEENRVILATNIAETSITLPGIELVVDTGLARRPIVDNASGLSKLHTYRISKANADQRAGRAGRTQAGRAIRLWSADEAMVAQPRPDIEHHSLFELYLLLCQLGEAPEQLPWLTTPNPLAWQKAQHQAEQWGWSNNGRLTQLGEAAMALATEPQIAKLILSQPEQAQAITLAAHLHCHGDQLQSLQTTSEVKQQLSRWRQLGYVGQPINQPLGDLLAFGFSHLLVAPNTTRTLAGQHLQQQTPYWRIVWQATPNSNQLIEHQSYRVSDAVAEQVLARHKKTDIQFQWLKAQPKKFLVTRVHAFELARQPQPMTPNDWQKAIIELLNQQGIDALLEHQPDAHWYQKYQYALRQQLLINNDDKLNDFSWLADYLAGITRFDRQQVFAAVKHYLDPHNLVDQTLPNEWVSPAGSRVAIDYTGPRASVQLKLQACFGLASQPQIANQPLQLQLCSPSGQPVAQTTDIKFFWQEVYPQVRKELRGRYNKHPWPEAPLTATATLHTNRQLRNES